MATKKPVIKSTPGSYTIGGTITSGKPPAKKKNKKPTTGGGSPPLYPPGAKPPKGSGWI